MKLNMTALFLTGVLACGVALPAAAADPDLPPSDVAITARPQHPLIAPKPSPVMADSVLYYGTITALEKNEVGQVVRLVMDSEKYGPYVMNLVPRTVYVDSSTREASDPTTLQKGERIYVYHSAMVTRSLPPQTAAFAVVRNLPMDAGVARYQEVEALVQDNGVLSITTDNGALTLLVDGDTEIRTYEGHPASLSDVRENTFLMAWYEGTGTVHADDLLLLPYQEAPITRARLAQVMHQQVGSPTVDYLMQFEDVPAGAEETEAIRWITSNKIMNGYTPQEFGYDDAVTLEQAVTALWRSAGSPRLMDYPGLTQYLDAGEISDYAASAMAWAHQKNLLDRTVEWLRPGNPISAQRADKLLREFAAL